MFDFIDRSDWMWIKLTTNPSPFHSLLHVIHISEEDIMDDNIKDGWKEV